MNCTYCGTQLNPGQRFCHRCGTPQAAAPAAPAPEFQIPAQPQKPAAPAQPLYEIPQPVYEPPRYVAPEPQPAYEPPKFEYHLPQSFYQPPDLNKPFTGPAPEIGGVDAHRVAPAPEPFPMTEPAQMVRDSLQKELPPVQVPPVPMQPAPAPAPQVVVNYAQPEKTPEIPHIQLPTGRSWAKMVFLGLITLGIYPFVIWNKIVTELNIVASRHDGERTTNFLGAGMLSAITLGIYAFVWSHGLCRRIGAELRRRNIPYRFGAADFWKWNFLGLVIAALLVALIFLLAIPYGEWIAVALAVFYLICPIVFVHKLMKSMNLLNQDFNQNG